VGDTIKCLHFLHHIISISRMEMWFSLLMNIFSWDFIACTVLFRL